jgi:integrase
VFCNGDGTPIASFKKSFANLPKPAGVEFVAEGSRRTIYSLRQTYAIFRLQDGVHQFVLAKNMGTGVGVFEKQYGHQQCGGLLLN